jgi:hypothetical protein
LRGKLEGGGRVKKGNDGNMKIEERYQLKVFSKRERGMRKSNRRGEYVQSPLCS